MMFADDINHYTVRTACVANKLHHY